MTDTLIDLNHSKTKREAFSDEIVKKIDAALEAQEDTPRSYIGASAIGDECARRVQLSVWASFHPDAPPIKQQPIDGKLRRIFRRGSRLEADVAEWLIAAGYDLLTRKRDGSEFGFVTADGQFGGHVDGLIRHFLSNTDDGHVVWENKVVNAKGWRSVQKHGVLKAYPKYDTQGQLYDAYLEMPATLFTFVNADSMEIHVELVPFDPDRAQAASDRAVHILRATRAGELLPRAAASEDVYPCRFCRFAAECWG